MNEAPENGRTVGGILCYLMTSLERAPEIELDKQLTICYHPFNKIKGSSGTPQGGLETVRSMRKLIRIE